MPKFKSKQVTILVLIDRIEMVETILDNNVVDEGFLIENPDIQKNIDKAMRNLIKARDKLVQLSNSFNKEKL